jgi:AraC-like DNA-binding protein
VDVLSDAIAAMRTGRPHVARTRLVAPWGLRFPPQDGAGFHAILHGTCFVIPEQGAPIALVPGDVVFLPHELGHAIADMPTTPLVEARAGLERRGPQTGQRTEMLCGAYGLDRSRPHPLMAELPDVVHIQAGRHPTLRGALDLLAAEAGTAGAGADAATSALLDLLLVYIVRAWYDEQPADVTAGWSAALGDPAVVEALGAIHSHPERPWTVQSLAARVGLSRAPFARRFTETVGSPPLSYLTWWRMTVAAQLLRESDRPLRSVAARTGYISEFAFAKAFKREFGVAPGRYREQPGPSRPDDEPYRSVSVSPAPAAPGARA